MAINSINRRREDLIKLINQIEDEELLISLEDKIFAYQQGGEPLSSPESFQIHSVGQFRSLIEQVLEDDRNGKMLDADEVFAELEKEWGIEEEGIYK